MSDKNWRQMDKAEREERFAGFNEKNTSPWLLEVIRKMCEGGSGHGSAIEAVRQQGQKDGKS
jgi:hypothetical protein